MIGEGLTGLDALVEARQQCYSGLALKKCKCHSMLLVYAAWAHQHGRSISLQNLTSPSMSLIHGALVGTQLPTINGAELNSLQFILVADQEFVERLPELFQPRNGIHRLPSELPVGLGASP